jgi:FkbM family methyltransferase
VSARVLSSREPHWALRRIAAEIDYRVPVDVRLANGMKIRVVWVDLVGAEICSKGCFEPDTFKIVSAAVKPGMVVMDVGAQVGQYTLLAAGLGARVHSFEADPQTFATLKTNVDRNRLTRVQLNHCAVTDHEGTAQFFAGPAHQTGTGGLHAPESSTRSYLVPCLSLDEYAKGQGIEHVDLIKIDVEGAEMEVLRGAREILSRSRKPTLVVEYAEDHQQAMGSSTAHLTELLRSFGYNILRIEDHGLTPYEPRDKEPPFFNVLAMPG